MHAKIFGVAEEEVSKTLYHAMVVYKLSIFLFCLIPYLVLRIIA